MTIVATLTLKGLRLQVSVNAVVVNPSHAVGEGLTFLEQLHALSVQLCSNPKVPFITGFDDKKMYLMRGTCKQWSCPTCGARNGRKWQAKILEHINVHEKGKRWFFITITAHKNAKNAYQSLKNIRTGWKKLYNRMRRKYGVSSYVKVWEFHKDGRFHLHCLIARKIGKKWLKDNSSECGMGNICDSSASKNAGQVVGYISKYLLKSFDNAGMYHKGMRRIECSRNWTQLPENESDSLRYVIHETRQKQDTYARSEYTKIYEKVDLRPSLEKELKIIDLG